MLLGDQRSIALAKLLHGIAILTLVAFGVGAGMSWLYYVALGSAAGVLAWEHRLVRPGDLSRLDAAFFAMNGIMSIVVLAGVLLDRLL